MRKLLFIFFIFSFALKAQDKLFFKDGTSKKGIIISIARDFIYFKTSDTSIVQRINKKKLVLMEDYKGNRFLFSNENEGRDSINLFRKKPGDIRNIFSIQPIGIFFGRANFVYERLSKDNKIGFVFPLTLTFDPSFGNIFNTLIDTTRNSRRIKGLNFMTGLDVNFYVGRGERTKFFVGPRIRYGTDVAFLDIEGYTVQTQFGWKISRPDKKIVQHLSFGFGFVRILSSAALRVVDSKQSYAWYSINYRLGIKW